MKKQCQWVVAVDRNTSDKTAMLQPAFVEFCYNKAVAAAFTADGTKVGRVCRKHIKAARLEKFNIERLK